MLWDWENATLQKLTRWAFSASEKKTAEATQGGLAEKETVEEPAGCDRGRGIAVELSDYSLFVVLYPKTGRVIDKRGTGDIGI